MRLGCGQQLVIFLSDSSWRRDDRMMLLSTTTKIMLFLSFETGISDSRKTKVIVDFCCCRYDNEKYFLSFCCVLSSTENIIFHVEVNRD